MKGRAVPNILGAQSTNKSGDPRSGPAPLLFYTSFLQCKGPFMKMCGHPNSQVSAVTDKIPPPGLSPTLMQIAASWFPLTSRGRNTIHSLKWAQGVLTKKFWGSICPECGLESKCMHPFGPQTLLSKGSIRSRLLLDFILDLVDLWPFKISYLFILNFIFQWELQRWLRKM